LRNPANAATNYGAALVFENTDGAAGNRQGLGRIAALRENNAASYSSYLQFSPTLNGSEFEGMRITSGGNVGIGAANPSYPLHIAESPSRIYRWNAHQTTYDYSFPVRGFYIVGFHYGFFFDNNTSAIFIIQVGSGYNNPRISRLVGGGTYPSATAVGGNVVRFSASSAPAPYNDWVLNIWLCGQGN
jgi:hypothetical protein